ncbi:hypothetical protein CHARACLAT_017384, partial [Characodon lateralis]|nr:hypothetical protein [Characodon lateralis]
MDQPQHYVSKKGKFWIWDRNSSLGLEDAQLMEEDQHEFDQQIKEEEEVPEPVQI